MHYPLGFTRKNDEGRVFVKISMSPAKWKRRSHIVYEAETGEKVPKGYILHHRDEDKANDSFSNLELMTNSDHVRLHNSGNKYRLGTKHSPEILEKISRSKKGFRHSEDSRSKISKSMKGKQNSLGHFLSEETKKKISLILKGVPKSQEHRDKIKLSWEKRRLKNENRI